MPMTTRLIKHTFAHYRESSSNNKWLVLFLFSQLIYSTRRCFQVAIAYWNTETITGAGIIIYPAQNSSALLVGALLLTSPFPDFVYRNLSAGPSPVSPTGIHPRYQQTMGSSPPYASPSRPPPLPSSSRHIQQQQQPISPTDQPGPSGRSDPYRYIMPRMASQAYPMSTSSSSGNPTWQVIKDEDNSDLSGFSSPPGGSHYPQ